MEAGGAATIPVQGAPSGRPSSAGSELVRGSAAPCGSSSGSRSGTLSWTGPGSPPLVPAARSSARATTARQERAAPGRSSASGITTEARTASPYIPTWSMVWLAPLPTSSTGRSALTTSRPTPLREASSTAGCRLATAVPEVTTTGTIRPDTDPSPTARKPAPRSSMRTCSRSRPSRSAA